MKINRILALILLSIMIFTACSSKTNSDDINMETSTSNENINDTTTTQIRSSEILPIIDYEGAEFTILGREYAKLGSLPSYEFSVESENGDIVNDTIYYRNQIVEENLNVKIISVIGDAGSLVPKSVMSGDEAYNLVWAHVNTMSSLTLAGHLTNYYDVPYIELTQPWWNQLATESLTLNGKCFLQMNYIPFTGVMLSHCLYVNKKILSDYNLDNPYELVDNNNWTIDEFARLAKSVSEDIDGNSEYDENDLYGFIASHGTSGASLTIAMGVTPLDIHSDGTFEMIMTSEKNQIILEKIVDITTSISTYMITDYSKENDIARLFAKGNGLFYSGFLTDAYQFFRDMEDDYGLLPFPKYDSNQNKYLTTVSGGTGLLGIPKSVNSTDITGHVTEALAIESYSYVYPAVFETVMSHKLLRDEESERMYKIIMDGLDINFARTFKYEPYVDVMSNLVAKDSSELTSAVETTKSAAQAHFEKVIAVYFDNEI